MLAELRVSNLGVIEEVTVVLGPGMTALTGETGAGKTLIVDAIGLLLGAGADPVMVRPGASEATVEGRFVSADGEETILCRVIPAAGRSRAYVDGKMAGAAQLTEVGSSLVDMHGQHAHQTLLRPAVQRAMLDRFGGIDTDDVQRARMEVRRVEEAQAAIGGDARNRARETDLLKFQLAELDAAMLHSPDEDEVLRAEEARLGDAAALRDAATRVRQILTDDDGVSDRIGEALALLSGKEPLAELRDGLAAVGEEIADLARDARSAEEAFEDDPERLAEVSARRQVISELRRKYGETLGDVISYRDEARSRLDQLESHEATAAALEGERRDLLQKLQEAETRLLDARRASAPGLGAAVEARLRQLAMPNASFSVEVDDVPPGDTVTWKLGANRGEAVLALTKVASGGELARTMLAARLAVGPGGLAMGLSGLAAGDGQSSDGPETLVFDEVDAGVGGEAATAVGRALAALGSDYQVLVVTHLPQVAAFADRHLVVRKTTEGGRTVAGVSAAEGADRVVEVSRMLSGSPESATARKHAEELLDLAAIGAADGRPERPTRRRANNTSSKRDSPTAPSSR